ncbi:MAG TPA: serine/threonine-protein kinase, partial [Egibacteraceae bacterium]|nr:serine/threonine-protein kinase [Egibacteraceae bacterium]
MSQLLAGRYELGETIGSGGMGLVVGGLDQVLQRPVAVKLLRDDLGADDQTRERFLREARAAASLAHPNAAAVYDAGRDGDVSFLVMELVEGESLAQMIARRGALPPAEAVALIDGVLAALGAAHRQGLIHRDVKPSNVLVTPAGEVKLTDFGIAKSVAEDAGLTLTGELLGTPRYLAPELSAGKPATAASDLYAAGVMLYELLAGRPPFEGDNPLSVALAHQRQSPAPLSALKPGLDERLVTAVDRAMSKDAGDRFPDAASFRAALGEAQSAFAVAEAAAPTLALGAQTMRLPAGGTPIDASSPGSRSGWLAAVGVAALLGFAALAASGIGAGEEPGAGAAPTAEEPSSPPATPTAAEPAPAETAPDAATTAPVESEPAPTDIEGLIAQLRDDPQAAGEKGEDLRELLEKVV